LFSFFKKESFTRKLILTTEALEIISSEYSLKELKRHSGEISFKSGLTRKELEIAFSLLQSSIKFVPLNEYKECLKEAVSLAEGFSNKDLKEFMDDIDFFALALKEKCSLWSEDKLFKKQSSVKIFTTKDLIRILRL
jgi:predicted nucleic acid-binding protein